MKTVVGWFQAVTNMLWSLRHAHPGAYLEGALCHALPPFRPRHKARSAKYTFKSRNQIIRGGVEDSRQMRRTQKNFEAKDRPSRDQGHRRKCSLIKKKVFKNFFQAKKVFKNFFQVISTWGNQKKRSLQIFCKVSGVFQRNCPRAEDRAIFEDLRLRGQGLQNVSSRTPTLQIIIKHACGRGLCYLVC